MNSLINNNIKNHDWFLTAIVSILAVIGTITIYSVTFNQEVDSFLQMQIAKQIMLIILGFVIYGFLQFIDSRWLKDPKILTGIYVLTICLLIYVLLFAPEIAGTNRWIPLGPINIQPAELAKIICILSLASILGVFNQKKKQTTGFYKTISWLILKSLLVSAPILLLILVQPSLGNTLITTFIILTVLLTFYPRKKDIAHFTLIFLTAGAIGLLITIQNNQIWTILGILLSIAIGLGLILKTEVNRLIIICALIFGFVSIPAATYSYNSILKDYQRARITSFLNPTDELNDANWQVQQSIIAIGSGRVFGKGFMEGTQGSLGILPFAHTDFIFAAFAEQFGFIGSILLITLLLLLPTRIFMLKSKLDNNVDKLIFQGIAYMFVFHILINVGMNLGKLPVTGIPLPFVSYGGTSIIVNMISVGLIQNILKLKPKDVQFKRLR